MSKLFKLKSFFTLDEAIRYLSDSLEEPVSLSDIYRLAMDKHLTLSVRLINQAVAIKGQIVSGQDGDLVQLQTDLVTGEALDEPYSVCIDDDAIPIDINKWFLIDGKVHVVDGVWDLVMIGMEALEIERLYQNEVNGPDPVVADAPGLYLKQGDMVCRLQKESFDKTEETLTDIQSGLEFILEPKGISVDDFLARDNDNLYDDLTDDEVDNISLLFSLMRNQVDGIGNYEDSCCLADHSCQYVIRTSELTRFVRSLQDEPEPTPPAEKALTTTERNTLLTFIDALLKEQQIDSSRKGLAPSLKLMTEKAGRPISENTIRKILNQVSDITA
ncbi:putative uncharacterized protein [Aliivibrio wodanis]|uniref:Uncharacterized protein n=1 Tax=Aliivibrio wodanis TaxID=80852 RepID=A0A090INX4_9GAMM|nr:putative uncharacterized protein [Aliivibrio wodanis]